jgi:pimeloyl-ACP methyl ester carboxylesterase
MSKPPRAARRPLDSTERQDRMTVMTTTTATQVTSADGTPIGVSRSGSGPALVLVDGALCSRTTGPGEQLAEALAGRFTVWTYDRRGRGDSGAGATPWTLDREVEDLAAVVEAAGGRAHAFGSSSGGLLALAAAAQGVALDRVVVHEAPGVVDATHPATDPAFAERVQALVDAGDRGGAVKAFLRLVGAPAPMVAVMRMLPVWRRLSAVAHTLPWDLSLVLPRSQGRPDDPADWACVRQPVLVLAGGRSPEYLRNAQASLAAALPDGRCEELPGQTHMVKAAAVAPVVSAFLAE